MFKRDNYTYPNMLNSVLMALPTGLSALPPPPLFLGPEADDDDDDDPPAAPSGWSARLCIRSS